MEDDKILSHEEERSSERLEGLQAKCQNLREKFIDEKLMEASHSNCLQDLLAIYKCDKIMQSKVILVFKDEAAVGDGVCRELYAVFCKNCLLSIVKVRLL